MQTQCPKCQNRLVLDDARVPAGPFMLKCPKCSATIKLPGKGDPAAPAPPASVSPAAPSPSPAATPAPAPLEGATAGAPSSSPEPRASVSAPSPPPVAAPPAPTPAAPPAPSPPALSDGERALVSFPSQAEATVVATMLGRLGYAVEALDGSEERRLRLQQGDYALVASAQKGDAPERDAYRLVHGLPPERRRRLFLVLVGDEFRSGEATEAFAARADLVLNPKDVPGSERLLSHVVYERKRLFQTFLDAEDRKLAGGL